MNKLFSNLIGSKSFRAGGYSAVAAAIVIAIAIAVNLVVGALPTTQTELDFTQQSLYSLSEQTERIVSSLDEDVTLYLLVADGNEDDTIVNLLARYKDLSSHIKLETVDPVEYPKFASAYTSDNVYQNSVIVVNGDRSRYVSYYDIYEQVQSEDYETYYTYVYYYGYTQYEDLLYDWVFSGENALTSAISYVTSDNLPTVYFMTGHSETEYCETLLSMMKTENFSYDSFSFIEKQAIPEDADIIVINAPQTDISIDEAEALMDYIDNGGNVVINVSYTQGVDFENLQLVTQRMGMKLNGGVVIEGNQNNYYRYPYTLLPDMPVNTITSALVSNSAYILYPIAMGIEHTEDVGTYTVLLKSSSDAYAKLAIESSTSSDKADGDIDGPFDLAAAVVDGEAHMVLFTSDSFINDSANSLVSGSNYDLLLNSMNWMVDMEDKISIRSKSLESTTLTVSAADRSTWSVIMIGVIPAALVILGVAIMIRRKRR